LNHRFSCVPVGQASRLPATLSVPGKAINTTTLAYFSITAEIKIRTCVFSACDHRRPLAYWKRTPLIAAR
jgi:hypothetical protein